VARGAVVGRLVTAGCVAAEEEADELLSAAPDAATLDAWVRRREHGEPLAWITGTHHFCGRALHVVPGVYVPRAQSEELARRAAARLPSGGRAVDLCTGAGAVAAHLAAAVPGAAVVGVDIDPRAAACAWANGVRAVAGDLDAPLHGDGMFDVVTAVAPYVPTSALRLLPPDVQRYEPRGALDGGADGLDVVRRVVGAGPRLLRPGGWLLVEVGGAQDELLAPALATAGFASGHPWWDEDGELRGVAARRDGGARGRDADLRLDRRAAP
jgi:release factor glutamine methyltransferase